METKCANKACGRSIDTNLKCDDYVQIQPCNCIMCPLCVFDLCANRKFSTPACDGCSKPIAKIHYHNRHRKKEHHCIQRVVEHHKAEVEMDPVRAYRDMFHEDREAALETMVVSLSFGTRSDQGEAEAKTLSVTLDRSTGPISPVDEINLRLMFVQLHSAILTQDKNTKQESNPRPSSMEFIDYCLNGESSLLLRLLYAFVVGKAQVDMKEIRKYKSDQSLFLAVCTIKFLIQRVNQNGLTPFHNMLGDLLFKNRVSNNDIDFLSRLRLCPNRRTIVRQADQRLLMSTAEQPSLIAPLEAFCLHFDNFGFKGKRGQYINHTVIHICRISVEQLKELGFYNKERPLSRDRQSIQQALHRIENDPNMEQEDSSEVLASGIVAPKAEDYRRLSTRILRTIETAISLDTLPSPADCYQRCNDRTYSWPGDKEIPSNLGVNLQTFQTKSDGEVAATYYEMNNVTLDHVLHDDPNSKRCVNKIAAYLETNSLVTEWDRTESEGEDPVRNLIAPATSDGSPAMRFLHIRAKDGKNYERARIFWSGFHYMMEFGSMRGRLSSSIFSFFGRLWRPSDAQLQWILLLRDPRDALYEFPEYLLCHYRTAAEESGLKDPVEVHEYMIKRAIDIPMCMAILFDLRLIEILLMIRDSEKQGEFGDVEMFLRTLRLALPLFCITHAINYVHLVCEFLKWYELASEAERVLYKRFYYAKLSPNGKPLWADRGVEWTVRHLRQFMGHRKRPNGHDQYVERTINDLPFRVNAQRELNDLFGVSGKAGYTTTDWNNQTFRIGEVYCKTRAKLAETNFWGQGPLMGELACQGENTMLDIEGCGKELPISASFLESYALGIERAVAYFKEFEVDDNPPGSSTRTEENVSLKCVPVTAKARQKGLDATRILRLSTNVEEVKEHFNKKKLMQELDFFAARKETVNPYTMRDTLDILAEAFCEQRRQYFDENEDEFQEIMDSLQNLEEADRTTTKEDRQHIVSAMPIYSLDRDIKECFLQGQAQELPI